MHKNLTIDPKYHVDEFEPTQVQELEFIRSPFYELGKLKYAGPEEIQDLMQTLEIKKETMFALEGQIRHPIRTNENASFERYADKVESEEMEGTYQAPTYKPFEIVDPACHFRV